MSLSDPRPPASPKAILLDLDNTVYAYDPCHEAALVTAHGAACDLNERWKVAGQFITDYEAARDAIKAELGLPAPPQSHSRSLYFQRLLQTHFGTAEDAMAQQLDEAYWTGYFSRLEPDLGCRELLQAWQTSSVRVAWVTNFTTERQHLKLKALGLDNLADFVLASEEAGAEKPDPAIFQLALKRLNVRPEEAWMVGDDLVADIQGGQAVGLTGVWLNRSNKVAQTVTPHFTVRDWIELRALWEKHRIVR